MLKDKKDKYDSGSSIGITDVTEANYEENEEHANEEQVTVVDVSEIIPTSRIKILKEILRLSVPYSINGLLINGSFFINTLIFSELGTDALAASSLMTSTQLLTVASAKASLSSTSVVAARNSTNERVMGTVLQQSWIQALLLTAPIAVIFTFSEQIFIAIGQDAEIAKIAGQYLLIYNIALPSVLLIKSSELFALAANYPNVVLLVTAINNCATAGLTYVLTLGKLGAPQLGVQGAAYAAALSTWVSFLGLTGFFVINRQFRKYNIFAFKQENRLEMLKTLFTVGLPIGIQVGTEFLYIFIKTVLAGLLGKASLSAEQIVTQYSSIAISPVLALSTVIGILVGKDIANSNSINVKRIGYIGALTNLVVPLVVLALFCAIPEQLSNLFLSKDNKYYEEIISLTWGLFLVNGINGLTDSIKNSTAGALRGFYDTAVPTIIMLGALWIVGVPASYLLAFPASLGVLGIFVGRGASLAISAPILLDRFRRKSNDPQAAIAAGQASLISKFSGIYSSCADGCKNLRGRQYDVIEEGEKEEQKEEVATKNFATQSRCVLF
jgi:MATE family multidrug resistance protein